VCGRRFAREPHSRTQNREKGHFFRVVGTSEAEGEAFLSRIATTDEICILHFEPKARGNPCNPLSPPAGKVIIAVFWDCACCGREAERGGNSDVYVRTLKELGKHLKRVRPRKDLASARQCKAETSLKTREATTKLGWTALPINPPAPT
jgi:hypothetical protein